MSAPALLEPSAERRRHGNIARSGVVVDTAGGIGRPWHCRGLLDNMLGRGEIGRAEWAAGEEFHRLVQRAGLDPLRSIDLSQAITKGAHGNGGYVRARISLSRALDVLGGLGSPAGSLALHVLGCDESLASWSRRQRWSGRNSHAAKGVLFCALSLLAQHFLLTPRAMKNDEFR